MKLTHYLLSCKAYLPTTISANMSIVSKLRLTELSKSSVMYGGLNDCRTR